MEKKKFWQTKTFWAGIAGLVSAGAGFATGGIGTAAAIQIAITSLIGIFMRQGIEKLKG